MPDVICSVPLLLLASSLRLKSTQALKLWCALFAVRFWGSAVSPSGARLHRIRTCAFAQVRLYGLGAFGA